MWEKSNSQQKKNWHFFAKWQKFATKKKVEWLIICRSIVIHTCSFSRFSGAHRRYNWPPWLIPSFCTYLPTYLPMLVYNLPMVWAMWPSTKTTALVLRWECKHPWQGTYLTIFIWPNPTQKWECKQSMPLHLQLTTFYTDLPRVQAIYEQGTPFDNFLAIKISEKGSKKISLKNDIEIHCSFFL